MRSTRKSGRLLTPNRDSDGQRWTAMDDIVDNGLVGIEQMDPFRLDRAAAVDSVGTAFSNSEKVFQNAQREDQTAWRQANPDVAQRVADEWADDHHQTASNSQGTALMTPETASSKQRRTHRYPKRRGLPLYPHYQRNRCDAHATLAPSAQRSTCKLRTI